MGWAHCGEDSKGREIGYAISATCDYPGCDAEIDRGLAYVCGGMHGEGGMVSSDDLEWGCEKYFCEEHKDFPEILDEEGNEKVKFEGYGWLCEQCVKEIEDYYLRGIEPE